MKWSPLIEDNTRNQIDQKLSQISHILMEQNQDFTDEIGLLGGEMGRALFLFYYAAYRENQACYDYALQSLHDIFDKVKNSIHNHSFCNGLSGIGWALQHLIREGFLEADNDILADLNSYLFEAMIKDLKEYRYDLLQGALGCAYYFNSLPGNKKTEQYLTKFIKGLAAIGCQDKEVNGIKWRDKITSGIDERNVYNLGLAHGIPGIIVFLSQIHNKNIAEKLVSHLLEKAVSYLLGQELSKPSLSLFPAFVGDVKTSPESRLGWCYGDLGIAVALWQAGLKTGNKKWEADAIRILLHSSTRKNLEENQVADACFCHGTSGIAHIFNRMYHHTGSENFKEACLFWIKETLNMALHHDGYAGYKAKFSDKRDNPCWRKDENLLKGITGIGLVLMAAVSHIEPKWDSCLMLS